MRHWIIIDHRSLQHPVKAYHLSNIIIFTLILPLLTEFDAHETRAIVWTTSDVHNTWNNFCAPQLFSSHRNNKNQNGVEVGQMSGDWDLNIRPLGQECGLGSLWPQESQVITAVEACRSHSRRICMGIYRKVNKWLKCIQLFRKVVGKK